MMKENIAGKIILSVLLIVGSFAVIGCDDNMVRGGAKVVLENINVGSLSMEGRPLSGLPTQNVNVVLNVATNEVRVNTTGGKTTMKLNPSGALVVISPEGTTFTGVKPDQIQIQWQTATTPATGSPVVTSFTANPSTITAGQSTTLTWNITGATSASISGLGAVSATTGTQVISPAVTTTYTLTATNSSGSATASATVTVTSTSTGLPVIASFSANSNTIATGQSSTLQWNVIGATSVSLSGIGAVSATTGTQIVAPTATTTYTLTAINSYGSASGSVTVTVTSAGPPVITSFIANPSTITAGQSSALQWNVTGASSVSISPGVGIVSSSGIQVVSVSPAATATYILTATNSSGSVTASATITVGSTVISLPVITSFMANPSTITAGQSTTLTWGITGATTVSISPGIGVPANYWGQTVSPTATTTYSITATNSAGSVTVSTTVVVR